MLYCCASEQTKWNHVSTAGVVFVPSPKLVQKGFTRIWFDCFCQDSFLVRRIVLLYLRHVSRCICGYLSSKPRILVTHQLQYLKEADELLVLSDVSISFFFQFHNRFIGFCNWCTKALYHALLE